jgi:hypothetical protein
MYEVFCQILPVQSLHIVPLYFYITYIQTTCAKDLRKKLLQVACMKEEIWAFIQDLDLNKEVF